MIGIQGALDLVGRRVERCYVDASPPGIHKVGDGPAYTVLDVQFRSQRGLWLKVTPVVGKGERWVPWCKYQLIPKETTDVQTD